MTRTVLVTGAAGFIGSHVVERLAAAATDRIVAIDVAESGRSPELSSPPGVESHTVDLRDADAIAPLVAGTDAIIHLAAMRGQASQGAVQLAHDVNVGSTLSLLTAAKDHGVQRIVFGSTNTVYGTYRDPDAPPVTETSPWGKGITFYAATKLAVEAYLEAIHALGGPDFLALRIGSVYGPRVAAGSNGALLLQIMADLDEGRPAAVPWTKESVHSFIFVDDLVEALVAAVDAPKAGATVNVAASPVTSEEFYGTLVRLAGHDPAAIEWLGTKARYQRVSNERMGETLGFVPRTTVRQGLQSFIDWHRTRD